MEEDRARNVGKNYRERRSRKRGEEKLTELGGMPEHKHKQRVRKMQFILVGRTNTDCEYYGLKTDPVKR